MARVEATARAAHLARLALARQRELRVLAALAGSCGGRGGGPTLVETWQYRGIAAVGKRGVAGPAPEVEVRQCPWRDGHCVLGARPSRGPCLAFRLKTFDEDWKRRLGRRFNIWCFEQPWESTELRSWSPKRCAARSSRRTSGAPSAAPLRSTARHAAAMVALRGACVPRA